MDFRESSRGGRGGGGGFNIFAKKNVAELQIDPNSFSRNIKILGWRKNSADFGDKTGQRSGWDSIPATSAQITTTPPLNPF